MTDILPFAITVAFIYIVYRAIKGSLKSAGKISETGNMVCTACGTRGTPGRHTKGSIFIELVLWLCFIIPGVIYSIWRLSSRQDICPACSHPNMIPVNTPAGKKLTTP